MNEEVKPTPTPFSKRILARRILAISLRGALVLLATTALTGAGLAWRLSQGPLDAAPAIPVLEKLMGDKQRLQFDIGALNLSWGGRGHPLVLEMDNLHLLGPRGEFMTIKRVDMGVSVWRLLLANLHFTYAKIQNLSVKLIRMQDGTITLTGIEEGTQSTKAESVPLEMDNIVKDLPSIEHLTLSDMRVIFEDRKDALVRRFEDVDMEVTEDRSFGKRSLTGYLTTALTGINDGSVATIDFIYDGDDKTLSSSISLDKADTRKLIGGVLRAANLPIIDMIVDGRAEVRLKNNFALDFLTLKLKGDDGMLIWPRNYGEGLENQKLTKFDLHVGFDPKTQALQLTNAEITVKGITLKVTGELSASQGWDKLKGALKADIPVVAVDALPAVWPKVWDSGGRKWLIDNMDKGRIANIDVDVPFTADRKTVDKPADVKTEDDAEPEYRWDIKTGTIKGTFDFTGVTVDYRHPMLPAANTTGTGVYEGLSLTLDITKAKIGDMDVHTGRIYFDDLITAGTGKADLHFEMKSPIKSVFEYLDREPISYRRKVDIDGKQAKGTADVIVDTSFPTTKDMRVEDVKVKASAKLHNLVMPNAVKGMTLAGPEFDLEASENHFKISGKGTIDGQPATLTWHELFSTTPKDPFASQLSADLTTNKTIRERFIGALEKRVDGIIPAKIAMETKPDGNGTLDVTADLTNARIDLTNPFNAVKEKGSAATATVKGTLKNGFIQSLDTLTIKGRDISLASGSIGFGRDAKNEPVLSNALLNGIKLGATDADIDATWENEHDIKAAVKGPAFDARWIMNGKKEDTADTTPLAYNVNIKTNKLYVADLPLDNVTASFVGNSDGTIKKAVLDGSAAGAPVTLRYAATGGADDALLWKSDNAGAALAAFGVTERVRGGSLLVEASPIQKGALGDMQGTITVQQFSVVKAPMLAKLVNLLSVPGLLNILSQDTGLRFERAESNLIWLNRPGGALIQVSDGTTSGSSLGLTFEGEIDMAKDTMNIQGTAVPMSEINSLISSIPLVGDILTGGGKGGGIFAATYTMRGPTIDPDVSVNPLSVLTPGILRRILFEGHVKDTSKDKPLTKDKTGSK